MVYKQATETDPEQAVLLMEALGMWAQVWAWDVCVTIRSPRESYTLYCSFGSLNKLVFYTY